MALFRYLRPVDSVLDPHGPLLNAVPRGVIEEVNQELKKAETQPRKRGRYLFFTAEEKAKVARYGSSHGVLAAVKRFSREFEKDLKENTVRDWVKAYNKELRSKCASTETGGDLAVTKLPSKKRGRPFLLGEKVDREVQTIIRTMRDHGAVVNTSITIATATGVVRKCDKSLEPLLTKHWAKSLLYRMGFVKRRGNTKAKVDVEQFEAIKTQFLFDLKATVEMLEIPPELVINWDQTGIKIVPVSSWTMEKRGSKRVEISGVDDKRQITAVFAATPIGEFLPFQLIYQGKTRACLPAVTFPSDWNVTYTPNRWSNEDTMKTYIKEIIVPYVKQKREQLKLSADHPALAIFDVFKGQWTEEVLQILEDNNIERVCVPANCTDRLQPLDVSINKPAKEFLRGKFQDWYAGQIIDQLDEETQQVDMRLSVMKPLCAHWLVDLYDHICANPTFIVNGFAKVGILDILGD